MNPLIISYYHYSHNYFIALTSIRHTGSDNAGVSIVGADIYPVQVFVPWPRGTASVLVKTEKFRLSLVIAW